MKSRPPLLYKMLFPTMVWRKKTDNIIYLTFDDGPVPGPTEFVLDTLSQFKISATFFCVGENAKTNFHIFKRISDEGHATGNHTYNHLNGWKTGNVKFLDNVKKCEEVFTSKMFRPPYGRLKPAQFRKLKEKYKIVMWDVLTGDYDNRISPEECLRRTIKASRPGSIVVFHDSYKAFPTMQKVLPEYIRIMSEHGYAFDKL